MASKATTIYYTPDEFFRREDTDGALFLRDGQRAAQVSRGFHSRVALRALMKTSAMLPTLIMYKCGVEWGLQDMKRFNNRMRHEFGGGKMDIWQMDPRFVFETWVVAPHRGGLGRLDTRPQLPQTRHHLCRNP